MKSTADVTAYLSAQRATIERALASVLPRPPANPPVLADAMRYSLTAGGKRVRPALCLAGAEAVGAASATALTTACALELIHTYSLIHDDLPSMDNDSLRRGQPTLHVVAGEGMAILAGDGLLTEAFRLLLSQPSTDPGAHAPCRRAHRRSRGRRGDGGRPGHRPGDGDAGAKWTPRAGTRRGRCGAHARDEDGALIRASAVAGAIVGGGSERRSRRSAAPPRNSGSPFRSSTTSSTSRDRPPVSARHPAKMPRPASPPIRRCTAWPSRGGSPRSA
jgi:geranylgeranyl diphosphate synthase type II